MNERGSAKLKIVDDVNGDVYYARVLEQPAPMGASEVRGEKSSRGFGCGGLIVVVLAIACIIGVVGAIGQWLHGKSVNEAITQAALVASGTGNTGSGASSSGSPPNAAATSAVPYAYSQLSDEDKAKYLLVEAAYTTRTEQPYPTSDIDDLTRIRTCVMADHPEIFYADRLNMNSTYLPVVNTDLNVSINTEPFYSESEAAALAQRLDEAAALCLAGIPDDADDYAKAKYLYEWLAKNVSYDFDTYMNSQGGDGTLEGAGQSGNPAYTIEGALLNRSAVCEGYAKAFQFLMQKLGCQCTFVSGVFEGGAHGWCLALLDDEYYYIDPTGGDPQADSGGELGYVNYDYLGLTSAELAKTHTLDNDFPLPDCTATADNYYVHEKLVFAAGDSAKFGMLAGDALDKGEPFQIRCFDDGAYSQLLDFVTSGNIGQYLPGGRYRYGYSDEHRSITILPSDL